MNIARLEDLNVIESIFAPFKKTYFPHIRQDYLKRKIDAGNVILEDGVVIVFAVYKRKQKIGTVEAQKGDAQIGQIVTATQGSGNASKILNKFFEEMNKSGLTVINCEDVFAKIDEKEIKSSQQYIDEQQNLKIKAQEDRDKKQDEMLKEIKDLINTFKN
jgi:hypothetical protein